MLGKFFLTLVVILIAILVLRKRRQEERRARTQASGQPSINSESTPELKPQLSDFRFAAYLFLVLMLGTGSYLFYQRWQDDNQIITITLHREGNSPAIHYKVFKKDLDERSFTTVDGIRVTVASSERMEVSGL
ncbi:MAG: hypothetical protein R3332_05345 [Pseudohongiellaceae bacterium]|nr:hypothetical protein [Pseudohongiellaceae bacterium]